MRYGLKAVGACKGEVVTEEGDAENLVMLEKRKLLGEGGEGEGECTYQH